MIDKNRFDDPADRRGLQRGQYGELVVLDIHADVRQFVPPNEDFFPGDPDRKHPVVNQEFAAAAFLGCVPSIPAPLKVLFDRFDASVSDEKQVVLLVY